MVIYGEKRKFEKGQETGVNRREEVSVHPLTPKSQPKMKELLDIIKIFSLGLLKSLRIFFPFAKESKDSFSLFLFLFYLLFWIVSSVVIRGADVTNQIDYDRRNSMESQKVLIRDERSLWWQKPECVYKTCITLCKFVYKICMTLCE